jgi:hypothetical protein
LASARGATAKRDLVRDTADCKPKPIDLSRADACDFIGAQDTSRCMLPFPDDYYTSEDADTETGKRIDFKPDAAPANTGDVHLDPADYAGNDGFSPGQTIVVRVPGLDNPEALGQTNPVGLRKLGKYSKKGAPVVVIDATTGERQPIWAEIDSNASSPDETALLIHPAKNFTGGHRYIVALRKLKDADGNTLAAPEGFRYYRDDLPSSKGPINDQRDRFESIFKSLKDADVKRRNLYLAWDFTVASNENVAKNILAMRDDAFAGLGDTNLGDGSVAGNAPSFQVTSVQNYEPTDTSPLPEDADMARRVQGTFTVPCYMTDPDGPGGEPPCSPGSRLNLDADGVPEQNGTWTANFNCMIPYAALDDPERGHVVAAEDARQHPRDHGLRHRRDRDVERRHRQHDRDPPEHERLPGAGRPAPAGDARRAVPGPAADPPAGVHQRSRLPGRRHPAGERRQPAGHRHVEPLLQRQQPGCDLRRRADRGRPRLHAGVARRRRHELLGAAEPLGRLRHLRGVPRSGLPGRALPAAPALDGADALGPRRVERLRERRHRQPAAEHAGA